MEPLLVLRGVREISEFAQPSAPQTVSQRAFDDAARALDPHLPPARRITERLALPWSEVLEVAHEPGRAQSFTLWRKQSGGFFQAWLTEEFVGFALRLVAYRLGKATLTRAVYSAERNKILAADRARWLHGRQLFLPSEHQILTFAGSWDAALSLAGLAANTRASRLAPVKHKILSRLEVMDRFHDAYGERPSEKALRAFARGNKLPMSNESGRSGRKWSNTVTEWETRRQERGLPPARVIDHRGGHKGLDYSLDVGAARPGEELYHGKWRDADDCTAWVVRYLSELGPRERSSYSHYEQWARGEPGAPHPSRFARHGGWEAMRRRAQHQCRQDNPLQRE